MDKSSEHLFLLSARTGDSKTFDRYLPVHTEDEHTHIKALEHAANYGHSDIVRKLLLLPKIDQGFEAFEHGRHRPLQVAVRKGHLEVVREILSFRRDQQKVSALVGDPNHLLELAVQYGHTKVVNLLVNEPLLQFQSLPLHLAAYKGNSEILSLLLSRKFPKSQIFVSKDGLTPLHLAAQSGCTLQVFNFLLGLPGMDVNVTSIPELFTPLHMASNSGHAQVVRFLLQSPGVNPMARDVMGRTALHYAAREGHRYVVQEFVKYSGDVDLGVGDWDGLTPLHMAARGGHVEVLRILISPSNINCTADHSVNLRGLLLDAFELGRFYSRLEGDREFSFARPKLIDSLFWATGGFTPLHFAARYGQLEAVNFLLEENSVNVLAEDSARFRPYDWATLQNQETKFMQLLEEEQRPRGLDNDAGEREGAVKKLLSDCLKDNRPEIPIHGIKKLNLKSALADLIQEKENMEKVLHPWEFPHPANFGPNYQHLVNVGMSGVIPCNARFFSLHSAAMRGDMASLKWLLSHLNIDVNEEDQWGYTALEQAVRSKKYDCASEILRHPELLLNHRVNSKIVDFMTLSDHKKKKIPQGFLREFVMRANVESGSGLLLQKLFTWSKRNGMDDAVRVIIERPEFKRRLYEDRQVYLDSANAILVVGALIASVAYQGWLQPPLDYDFKYFGKSYANVEEIQAVRKFWWFNSFAFFFSVATVIAGATGAMPVVDETDILKSVEKVKRAVVVASVLLGTAVVCVMGAFSEAGFAVLPPLHRDLFIMAASVRCGAIACALIILWFCSRLWPLLVQVLHLPTKLPSLFDLYKHLGETKDLTQERLQRAVTRETSSSSCSRNGIRKGTLYCIVFSQFVVGHFLILLTRALLAIGLYCGCSRLLDFVSTIDATILSHIISPSHE